MKPRQIKGPGRNFSFCYLVTYNNSHLDAENPKQNMYQVCMYLDRESETVSPYKSSTGPNEDDFTVHAYLILSLAISFIAAS